MRLTGEDRNIHRQKRGWDCAIPSHAEWCIPLWASQSWQGESLPTSTSWRSRVLFSSCVFKIKGSVLFQWPGVSQSIKSACFLSVPRWENQQLWKEVMFPHTFPACFLKADLPPCWIQPASSCLCWFPLTCVGVSFGVLSKLLLRSHHFLWLAPAML